MYVSSFKINALKEVSLELFDKVSSTEPVARVKIDGATQLHAIRRLVQQLPDVGHEMIKMGDVPLLRVQCVFESGPMEYFDFYNGRLKTVDTTFYSLTHEVESLLYKLLSSYI
jgi:hypothetical protein